MPRIGSLGVGTWGQECDGFEGWWWEGMGVWRMICDGARGNMGNGNYDFER